MEEAEENFLEKKEKRIEEGMTGKLYVNWHNPGSSNVQ